MPVPLAVDAAQRYEGSMLLPRRMRASVCEKPVVACRLRTLPDSAAMGPTALCS